MEEKERKKRRRRQMVWKLAVTACVMIFAVSVFGFARTYIQSRQEDKAFKEISNLVVAEPETKAPADGAGTETEKPAPELSPTERYGKVKERNDDFVAWLKIDDTPIDYPVMSTPEDMQYYIRRDFNGKDSVSGTLFLGDDFDPNSMSVIIYGHNMKNDTMFGSLDKYAKESYWKDHSVLQFNTMDEYRDYEIFAAFQTRLLYVGEEGFGYYGYTGELTPEEFEEFVDNCRALTPYDTGIVPEYGDQLVMLSTCSYHTQNGRYVVVARRRNEN